MNLNEYGLHGKFHEVFELLYNVTFGEYIIQAIKDGRIRKEELAERARIALQRKVEMLPENPDIKKS